jgi:hypothetical protein
MVEVYSKAAKPHQVAPDELRLEAGTEMSAEADKK